MFSLIGRISLIRKKDFWLRNVTVADGDDDGGCWSISDSGHSVSPCGGDAGLVVVVAEPGGDVGGVSDRKKGRGGGGGKNPAAKRRIGQGRGRAWRWW